MSELYNFPSAIQVVIGSGWTASAPFSEDDVIDLQYFGNYNNFPVPGTTNYEIYTEDGTDNPSATNRLKVAFRSNTNNSDRVFVSAWTTATTNWYWAVEMTLTGVDGIYEFLDLWMIDDAPVSYSSHMVTANARYNPEIFKGMTRVPLLDVAGTLSLINGIRLESNISLVNSLNIVLGDDLTLKNDIMIAIGSSLTLRNDIKGTNAVEGTLKLTNHVLGADSGFTQGDFYYDEGHGVV